jgi:hypothetical protein
MLTTHLHQVPRLRMSGAIPLLPLYALMAWTGMTFTANQLAFCTDSFCCEEMVSVQSEAYSSHISPNCSVTAQDQPLFKWDFNVTSWVPGRVTVCDNEAAGAITRVANLQVIILLFILNLNFRTAICQCNLAKWQKAWDHTWGEQASGVATSRVPIEVFLSPYESLWGRGKSFAVTCTCPTVGHSLSE